MLKVSPRTPDPLDVSNNVTAKPTAGSSFLFAQLYNEYGTYTPTTLLRSLGSSVIDVTRS